MSGRAYAKFLSLFLSFLLFPPRTPSFLTIGLTQLNNQEYSEALEDKLQQHVE